MQGDSFQDWKPDILTNTGNKSGGKSSKPPPSLSAAQKKTISLDNATEPDKITLLPRNIAMQLMSGRVAKKLTQKHVATTLNLPIKTIQEMETGRYKNDMQLAQRIAKSLGIKLVK